MGTVKTLAHSSKSSFAAKYENFGRFLTLNQETCDKIPNEPPRMTVIGWSRAVFNVRIAGPCPYLFSLKCARGFSSDRGTA